MWACLGSTCLGLSVLPVSWYQIPLDLKSFKIISSNIFSIPFSSSSPSEIPIMHRLACFILSYRSLILLSCFFICFSVCCPDWVISIILSSMCDIVLNQDLFPVQSMQSAARQTGLESWLYAFCILISVSFRFGKFSAIISSNIFSIPFSLFLLEFLLCVDWPTLY